MSARTSIAILWLLWARLENDAAAADSRERVHIRLHMPEVVRKHTHFHKVYKHVPLPIAAAASPPVGKPHVSLLGYTTTASGSGGMAPSVMQLMATAATPTPMAMPLSMSMSTLKPNYGPALFNNYNQQQPDPPATTSAPSKLGQQQLLDQLLASITAAQQQRFQHQLGVEPESESELEPELDSEAEPETQVENNELLNGNFLAALQREYLAKFGSRQRKRKKQNFLSKTRSRPKPQPLLSEEQQLYEEYQEDEPVDAEDETYHHNYYHAPNSWTDLGENEDDSATAFSGQNNAFSGLPSIDAFLNDVGGGANPYAPHYDNIYREYGNAGHADSLYGGYDGTPSINYSHMSREIPKRPRPRQRRPSISFAGSGSGNAAASGNATKVRYIKLTTRKKRKDHIRAKRYRT